MNKEFRQDFARRVNTARSIRDPRYGRERLISHADFTAFRGDLNAALGNGEISERDHHQCCAFIGAAVNGPGLGA